MVSDQYIMSLSRREGGFRIPKWWSRERGSRLGEAVVQAMVARGVLFPSLVTFFGSLNPSSSSPSAPAVGKVDLFSFRRHLSATLQDHPPV
jgi:hypothetical protein